MTIDFGTGRSAIASSIDGNAHVVFEKFGQLWYSRYDSNAREWVDGSVVADLNALNSNLKSKGTITSLTLLTADRVVDTGQGSAPGFVAVWQQGSGNSADTYYAYAEYGQDGDLRWSQPIQINKDAIADLRPSATLQISSVSGAGERPYLVLAQQKVDLEAQNKPETQGQEDDTDLYYARIPLFGLNPLATTRVIDAERVTRAGLNDRPEEVVFLEDSSLAQLDEPQEQSEITASDADGNELDDSVQLLADAPSTTKRTSSFSNKSKTSFALGTKELTSGIIQSFTPKIDFKLDTAFEASQFDPKTGNFYPEFQTKSDITIKASAGSKSEKNVGEGDEGFEIKPLQRKTEITASAKGSSTYRFAANDSEQKSSTALIRLQDFSHSTSLGLKYADGFEAATKIQLLRGESRPTAFGGSIKASLGYEVGVGVTLGSSFTVPDDSFLAKPTVAKAIGIAPVNLFFESALRNWKSNEFKDVNNILSAYSYTSALSAQSALSAVFGGVVGNQKEATKGTQFYGATSALLGLVSTYAPVFIGVANPSVYSPKLTTVALNLSLKAQGEAAVEVFFGNTTIPLVGVSASAEAKADIGFLQFQDKSRGFGLIAGFESKFNYRNIFFNFDISYKPSPFEVPFGEKTFSPSRSLSDESTDLFFTSDVLAQETPDPVTINFQYKPPSGLAQNYNEAGSQAVTRDAFTDVVNDGAPSLATPRTNQGIPYIAWVAEGDGNPQKLPTSPDSVIKVTSAGADASGNIQWVPPTIIPGTVGFNYDPVIGFPATDKSPVVVWTHADAQNATGKDLDKSSTQEEVLGALQKTDIYYSVYDGATFTWSNAAPIVQNQPGSDHKVVVGDGPNGQIMAAWLNIQPEGNQSRTTILWSQWDGTRWSQPQALQSFIVQPSINTELQLFKLNGQPTLAWSQTSNVPGYAEQVLAAAPLVYLRLDDQAGGKLRNISNLGDAVKANLSGSGSFSLNQLGALSNDATRKDLQQGDPNPSIKFSRFSSKRGFVEVEDLPSLFDSVDKSFSLEFWYKQSDLNNRVLARTYNVGVRTPGTRLELSVDQGKLTYRLGDQGKISAKEQIKSDQWYYLAATYNADTQQASFFINGIQVGTAAVPASEISFQKNKDFIGQFDIFSFAPYTLTNSPFDGPAADGDSFYDEIALYNYDISRSNGQVDTSSLESRYAARGVPFGVPTTYSTYSTWDGQKWQMPQFIAPQNKRSLTELAAQRQIIPDVWDVVSPQALAPNDQPDLAFQISLGSVAGKVITRITLSDGNNTWQLGSNPRISDRLLGVVQVNNQALNSRNPNTPRDLNYLVRRNDEKLKLFADQLGLNNVGQTFTVIVGFSDGTSLQLSPTKGLSSAAGGGKSAVGRASIKDDKTISLAEINSGFILNTDTTATFGSAVVGGDLDGDKISDLVIGTSANDQGTVLVMLGGGGIAGYGGNTLKPGQVPTGGDRSGILIKGVAGGQIKSLAIGDVDGDGKNDLVIGAPKANDNNGRVYVVFGSALRAGATIDVNNLTSDQGFFIDGADPGGLAGYSVAVGNLRNASNADIVFGSPQANEGAGAVYVVYGGSNVRNSRPVKVLAGKVESVKEDFGDPRSEGWQLGFSVDISRAGGSTNAKKKSVNGDALDDLIIGAPNVYDLVDVVPPDPTIPLADKLPKQTYMKTGRAFVVLAQANGSGLPTGLQPDGKGLLIFSGKPDGSQSLDNTRNQSAGFDVSSAGDLNGDGIDDLTISAPDQGDNTGAIFVTYGNTGLTTRKDTQPVFNLLTESNLILRGAASPDRAGMVVNEVADVNGDKIDDLLITAPSAAAYTGQGYVVFGNRALAGEVSLSPSSAAKSLVVSGGQPYGFAGMTAAGIGDVNKDGANDYVFSAPGANQVYVVYGHTYYRSTNSSLKLDKLRSDDGFVIEKRQDGDGKLVRQLEDVNRDGFADLAIGGSANGFRIVFGGSTRELLDAAAGNRDLNLSQSGRRVETFANVGDFNGDGFADIGVGLIGDNDRRYIQIISGQKIQAAKGKTDLQISDVLIATSSLTLEVGGIPQLTGLGDINGDGLEDFALINRLAASGSESVRQNMYVVFGTTTGALPGSVSDIKGNQGFKVTKDGLETQSIRDFVGINKAGDFNGDGFDDVLVYSTRGRNVGAVQNIADAWVIYGGGSFSDEVKVSIKTDTVTGAKGQRVLDKRLPGDPFDRNETRFYGFSGEGKGDYNGDGFADIAMASLQLRHVGSGAFVDDFYLELYVDVLYGSNNISQVTSTSRLIASDKVTLTGSTILIEFDPKDLFTNLSTVGDTNGDGFDDLLIGVTGSFNWFLRLETTYFDKSTGESYLLSGGPDLSKSTVKKITGVANSAAGASVSGGGDINGDSFADMVIGAPGNGSSYVLFGENDGKVNQLGTIGNDVLNGSATGDNILTGAGGDDIQTGGGRDVVYAGPNNDLVAINDIFFRRVDGGPGEDTLRLTGYTNQNLDLTKLVNRVQGFEILDITGYGANRLLINDLAFLNLSDTSNQVIIDADKEDTVLYQPGSDVILDQQFRNGVYFTRYRRGNLTVLIEPQVQVLPLVEPFSLLSTEDEESFLNTGDEEFFVADTDSFDPTIAPTLADPGPTELFISSPLVDETEQRVEFVISRTGDLDQAMTVQYVTADDTAQAGLDYMPISGKLVFAPGEASRSVFVPIMADTVSEETLQDFLLQVTLLENEISDSRHQIDVRVMDAGGKGILDWLNILELPEQLAQRQDAILPLGVHLYDVTTDDGRATVTLDVDSRNNINSYYKPNLQTGQWEEFLFDGQTGARFIDTNGDGKTDQIQLSFVDGGRGDADGLENGIIQDPGAVAISSPGLAQVASGVFSAPTLADSLVQFRAVATLLGNYEFGFFTVDDVTGRVDNLAPGTGEYLDAALARKQTVFANQAGASGATLSATLAQQSLIDGKLLQANEKQSIGSFSNLNLPTGQSVVFYLQQNNQISLSTGTDFQFTTDGRGYYQFQLGSGSSKAIFEAGTSALIAPGAPGQQVTAKVQTSRAADFNNTISLYRVDNLTGGLDIDSNGSIDLIPGDAGYAIAALQRALDPLTGKVLQSPDNLSQKNETVTLSSGSVFGLAITANGSVQEFLSQNPMNQADKINTFFSFEKANPDGISHIVRLGNSLFGFEDLFGGDDRDYNDVIVGVTYQEL